MIFCTVFLLLICRKIASAVPEVNDGRSNVIYRLCSVFLPFFFWIWFDSSIESRERLSIHRLSIHRLSTCAGETDAFVAVIASQHEWWTRSLLDIFHRLHARREPHKWDNIGGKNKTLFKVIGCRTFSFWPTCTANSVYCYGPDL